MYSPPKLPPDSPGSSVSSRFQNEYEALIRRAVVISHEGSETRVTMNPTIILGQRTTDNKDPADGDSSNQNTHRTDATQYDVETERQQLSRIPSLQQLIHTATFSLNDKLQNPENNVSFTDCNDPMVHHFFRYSELLANELEAKPITEKMDHWYLDLKKNLMTEFDKLRLQFLEEAQQAALREKQAQAKEFIRLNQDIKTMREMLMRYEQKIDEKEQIERNLNKALDFLYNKTLTYRRYYEWRIIHIERERQQYGLSLAKRFYEDKMKRKALINWKGYSEQEWKKRFEVACEKKAKDVLVELGNEYELKYKQLELQLMNANEEIARLRIDKSEHDEALKKAFMRGVCALNMEAMSVLLKKENELETSTLSNDDKQRRCCTHHDHSIDEGVISTGDEENLSKCSSYCQTYPAHVYKEHLPSTIYSTGEARTARNTGTHNHQHRRVTFQKCPSTATNRSRCPNNHVLVERHAPTNNVRS